MGDTEKKPTGYWNIKGNVDAAAKECQSRSEFKKKYNKAYNNARKNSWLEEYTWLKHRGKKPNGFWNYNTCLSEAKKYSSLKEFRENNKSAYDFALQNGWLNDYYWIERKKLPNGYWNNYDNCFKEAQKYTTSTEFEKKNAIAYRSACKNGWISDYTWFERKYKPNGYWNNYENCYNEAKKYKTITEFNKHCSAGYNTARVNGWLNDYEWFERNIDPYKNGRDNVYAYFFTELKSVYIGRTINPSERNIQHNTKEDSTVLKYAQKNCVQIPTMTILESGLTLNEGLIIEDNYRKKYEQEGWNVINIAKTGLKSGSLGACSRKWTYISCYKEAQKYNTRKEFQIKNGSAYSAARKNGWLKDYIWFESVLKPKGYWNYDTCFNEAKKCKTRNEFFKNSPTAYNHALKNGWLDDYDWFVTGRKIRKWTYEVCSEEVKKYNTRTEFRKNNESAYQTALKHGWLDEFFPKVAA